MHISLFNRKGSDANINSLSVTSSSTLLRQALSQLLHCWIDSIQASLSDQLHAPGHYLKYRHSGDGSFSSSDSEFEFIYPESQSKSV